jgi:uracil-DNA glycosylase
LILNRYFDKMEVKIENSWKMALKEEFSKQYFTHLVDFVRLEYKHHTVFPKGNEIFNAFEHCPFDKIKVVILGQDPYHGPDQAHGLSFSVREGVAFPPSLVNIFKELNRDLDLPVPANGNLTRWADQGVLLLNATLTVRAHQAGSHQQKGWETFTDAVIRQIAQQHQNVVFMLWGSYAQKKAAFIDSERHLKLHAPHPSPLSAYRGFIGCGHFSQANSYLISKGKDPIVW